MKASLIAQVARVGQAIDQRDDDLRRLSEREKRELELSADLLRKGVEVDDATWEKLCDEQCGELGK